MKFEELLIEIYMKNWVSDYDKDYHWWIDSEGLVNVTGNVYIVKRMCKVSEKIKSE